MTSSNRSVLAYFFTWSIGLFWGYVIGKGLTEQWFGTAGSILASFGVGVLITFLWPRKVKS
jgi:hypothetical protein